MITTCYAICNDAKFTVHVFKKNSGKIISKNMLVKSTKVVKKMKSQNEKKNDYANIRMLD